MNFDMAREMAEMDGIRVESVVVRDDVAVPDSTYSTGRRGIAGTVFVHKIAGAKAETGASLDEVKAAAEKAIANILLEEGYVKGVQVIADDKQGVIRIALKYTETGAPVISGIRRVSKPGLRIYTNCEDMPKVMKGLGTAIISTSKGVMTDKAARANNVGGEVLAFVW